ncbi:MAG: hypothetical protein ACYCSF_01135 [Acidimicrobiales bacterium]
MLELTRILGGLRWVELEGFALLGRLAVAGLPPPGPLRARKAELAVWASASSLAHAWRAGQLEALLPVSVGLPSLRESTGPPGAAVAEWTGLLSSGVEQEAEKPPGAVSRWYELLAAAYETRAAHAHPSADGPLTRTLERLVANVHAVTGDYPAEFPHPGREGLTPPLH